MNYTHKLARRLARLRPAAVPAACGRWSSDGKIGRDRAVQHHLVCGTFPILTLLLLLAACADSSAPVAPDGGVVDMYQVGRGWVRRLVGIRISPDPAVVSPGQTIAFKASGVLSDGSSKPVTVSWVATGGTIDSAGLFTAGSTTGAYHVVGTELTLGLADTAAVVDTAASVDQPAPTVSSVSVSPSSSSILVGGSVQLTATARDSSGTLLSGIAFAWASSTPGVAAVTSGGLVTALSQGTVSVTATAQGVSNKASVAVTVPVATSGCPTSGFKRLVTVSTTAQLNSALLAAQPGDQIQLADGTYTNNPFWIKVSGTAASPITLCGSRLAKVGTGSISTGNGIALAADYWNLQGFTLTNSMVGLAMLGGHRNVLEDLSVHDVGQAGLHLRQFSTHNIVRDNYIHDTGKYNAVYGEGVYLGSWNGHWVNGVPDRSDSNTVMGNTIGPNIGSEMVDVKEGVTGTVLQGNSWVGGGQSLSTTNLVSWVVIFGNRTTVTGNRGQKALLHGYKVENPTGVSGWGQYTTFQNETLDLSGASGYGIWVGVPKATTTISCNNIVLNAGSGLANMACTP
jgi:hypothetical protein